jgi:predicted DNA-binding WGR domain protein
MTRYFEFQDENSDKFWEVAVDGTTMTVRYGKRDTQGQSKQTSFNSESDARNAAEKLIREKTGKGYVEIKRDGALVAADPAEVKYKVTVVLPDGKDRELNVVVGKDVTPLKCRYWKFSFKSPPEQFPVIFADLNRRQVPMGLSGIVLNTRMLKAAEMLTNVVDVCALGFIDDDGLRSIAKHSKVEDLGVEMAEDCTDAGLIALASLTRLRRLEFVICGSFTDKGIASICKLTALEDVSFGEANEITDAALDMLLALPNLKKIAISGAKLSEAAIGRMVAFNKNIKKKAVGARVEARGAVAPGQLVEPVLQQFKRLGVKLNAPKKYPPETKSWPEQARRLVFDLKWPKGATYTNDEESENHVWGADFSGFQAWDTVDFSEWPSLEGRPFALLGITDGGNYMISIALDSDDLADPDIYIIDHDEREEPLPEPTPLSEFLAGLEREEDEDAE